MVSNSKAIGLVWLLLVSVVVGQTVRPQIGYLYPAGGQRGTELQIVVGGQALQQAKEVFVSGEGVRAEVVHYFRPLRNINGDQRKLLMSRLKEVRDQRLAELAGKEGPLSQKQQTRTGKAKAKAKADPNAPEIKMPEHPLLDNLDDKSLRELAHIQNLLFFPRALQQINRQIAEMVLVKITIDKDAEPGSRELRLVSQTGMTNPVVFQVGLLPETQELEPNDKVAYPELPNWPKDVPQPMPPENARLPMVFNGQILPGDRDRFRFQAEKGQHLVVRAAARALIPYLADAVPGWFQATVALYDDQGHEVAYADDYEFDPDPVLFYEIPRTGAYEVEIHDSIYRGREDFVYRIAVGELPFITDVFPLGGRLGVETTAKIHGWNLTADRVPLDTRRGEDGLRHAAYRQGDYQTNPIQFAVDVLPEADDTEDNDTPAQAQVLKLPRIVNGRINRPGDVDVFRVTGRAGDTLVAEVLARQLNSPLDSLVRITDSEGAVVALNDDYECQDSHLYLDVGGLVTHHADSYAMAKLPRDGDYFVALSDTQRHGGPEYGYRLRLSAPRPDFALRITPSSFATRAGGVIPLTVHVLRQDGFDGDIRVTVQDAPEGFEVKGGVIPAGRDRIRFTLTAPTQGFDAPVAVTLAGLAQAGRRTLQRRIVPAEDTMQAFLYRHLVPAQDLMVTVQKARWALPPAELAGHSVVKIPIGGSALVKIDVRLGKNLLQETELQLNDPPPGLSLDDVATTLDGLTFRLHADKESLALGYTDNLIIETIRSFYPKDKSGKLAKKKNNSSMGFLPAIPIEIVE